MDSELRELQNPTPLEHPGEMVLEYLEHHGWSQSDLARRTGLTPKTVSEICNGKAPVTPPTALALEKVFSRPAHLWLNLQRQFDEDGARRRELQLSLHWREWAQRFPLKEMKALGWFSSNPPASRSEVETLLSFLGVSSPDSWESVWDAAGVAYRQTRTLRTSPEAISAWVRATEIAVSEMKVEVAEFSEERLYTSIKDLRRLTGIGADKILEPLQTICGAAGVAVVLVPGLQHTGISGSARWLTDKKAVIALTLRYKTDDQLWYTFFHELGHVLLHRRKRAFVLDNPDSQITDRVVDPEMQRYEDEANRFASDTLIPPGELSNFMKAGMFTNETILKFAERLGIGPGLVVGRLQHDGVLKQFQGNTFKQKLGFPD
jgi:addiction module HigA family antidote